MVPVSLLLPYQMFSERYLDNSGLYHCLGWIYDVTYMLSQLVKPDNQIGTYFFSNELYEIPQLRTKLRGGPVSLNIFTAFVVLNTLHTLTTGCRETEHCNLLFWQETFKITCITYVQVGTKQQFRKRVVIKRFDVFVEVITNIAVLRDMAHKFADSWDEILVPTLKKSSLLLQQEQHVPPKRLWIYSELRSVILIWR